MFHKLLLLCCLSYLQCFFAEAENDLRFGHISNASGLSGTAVNSVLQDSRGFIWIGTDFGLNRFDSKSFLAFKNKPDDSTTISGNKILKIIETKDGMLWMVTDGGLCSLHPQRFHFSRFILTNNKLTTNEVNEIQEDAHGNLWIGTGSSGWGKFDRKTNSYCREDFKPQLTSNDSLSAVYQVNSICSDAEGTLYFGSLSFSLIIKKQEQYFFVNRKQNENPSPAHTIRTVFCDSKNNIRIGAWDNALHTYNKKYNSLETIFIDGSHKIDFSGNEITSINEDEKGNLWIGTSRKGLFLFNPVTKIISNYIHDRNNHHSISSNDIRCIYRDRQNRMWVGTSAGLDIFDPLLNQFELNYLPGGNDAQVFDFLETENNFFIAASDGIWMQQDESSILIQKKFNYKNEPLSITELFRDSYGTLYAGTNKTVFTFDEKKFSLNTFATYYDRIENAVFDFYNISSSRIVSIAQSNWHNRNVLWISPYGHGLAVFDIKTKTGYITSLFGDGQFEHLINKIFVDSKQNVFCLTANHGITRNFSNAEIADSIFSLPATAKKKVSGKINPLTTHFLNEEIKNLPVTIFDMIENEDGSFWITSSGSGLYKLNLNDAVHPLVHHENNFPVMYGLQKDTNGNLWIISNAGIEFFDVKEKIFRHFDETDGIPKEGLQRYFYRDKNGYFYAGGKGYYLKFRPESIRYNHALPAAAITHFKIFDRSADSLLQKPSIKLSYRQNYFSFEFASLNYTDASENNFAYMLEGFDGGWIYSGTRNYAAYTNLAGGNYAFKLKASNNQNVWSKVMTFPVFIKPPLWQYSWFWPLVILFSATLVFLFYRNRINERHRIQTIKLLSEIEAQEKERNRIARDLHDEFGTKISSFKIYLSTYEKFVDHQNTDAMNTGKELHAVVDDSLSDLRNLLMDLSPKILQEHGFAAAISELINRLNKIHLFVISYYIAPELRRFEPRHELILYRISQELINNSIKHAACTEINLQLFYREEKLVFNYDDNGKGFEMNEKNKTGYGISNIETRASLLNGSVIWESKPGYGMNVRLEIPYNLKTN